MGERHVNFVSGDLRLEGLLGTGPGDRGVVVTHPHPLYGGDMHNSVVRSVVEVYQNEGYSTLRFNFRGAGASEGEHDNGVGEQEDVVSALHFLAQQGKHEIDLAGYSFGAWVNVLGPWRLEPVARMILISPPVSFVTFPALDDNPKIELVIAGTCDQFAELGALKTALRVWSPQAVLKTIEGADHFYSGRLAELERALGEFLEGREESGLK